MSSPADLREQLLSLLNPVQRTYMEGVQAEVRVRIEKLRAAVSPVNAKLAVSVGGALQDILVKAVVAGLTSDELVLVLEAVLEQQREASTHNLMLASLDVKGKVAAA